MALDFAIDELGLYLVTHADDQEVLNLYWKYIALAKEGRARYQEQYGPLTQTIGCRNASVVLNPEGIGQCTVFRHRNRAY